MAHNNVTTWTCDRCGRKVEMAPAEVPAGWTVMKSVPVDKGVVGREWEVCGGCYSMTERLLMNQAQPEGNGTVAPESGLIEVTS